MPSVNPQALFLPPDLETEVARRLRDWDAQGGTRRLWDGDATLWTGGDEASWLGWIGVVERQLADIAPLHRLQEEVRREGFAHALLLGMGGSSLGPEVLAETFPRVAGFPTLLVLDSTDPAQVRAFEERVDPARALFIVSSKSGTTLEPSIFKAYFFERAGGAGRRFLAVTDPGSALHKEAEGDGFRAVFPGEKSIGGRYSVLSNFGLVPAAVMGLDVERLLREALAMVNACSPGVPAAENPGLVLGTLLGVAATRGLDKLTLVASPGLHDLGAWLEQLVAESTGKQGKAVVPVDRERLGPADLYGEDRLFAYLRLQGAPDPAQDAAVAALEKAGRPVVRIELASPYGLGQEFFRWEVATAVAGAVLGINPFDQPDVEASKVATKALTSAFESAGGLPAEPPLLEAGGLQLFGDPGLAAARSLVDGLRLHLNRLGKNDYFALLAYVHMSPPHEAALQAIRHQVRDRRRVATCLGFGPRFLHSTGQAYKGGPNRGVFLQVTCDDAVDLPLPGRRYTFGVVKAAQARGDFQVLIERGRRALRVHLPSDVGSGLRTLAAALAEALG